MVEVKPTQDSELCTVHYIAMSLDEASADDSTILSKLQPNNKGGSVERKMGKHSDLIYARVMCFK